MDAIAISGIIGIALPKITWPLFLIAWVYYIWKKRNMAQGTKDFLFSFRFPLFLIAAGLIVFILLATYERYRFVNFGIVSDEPRIAATLDQASGICKSNDPKSVLMVVTNKETNTTYGRCDDLFKFTTYLIKEESVVNERL